MAASARQPYLGPAAKVGERVPYLGPATTTDTRTPYLGDTPAAPHHGGGGGILGGLEHAAHWTAGKAGFAAHDLKQVLPGTVELVNAERKAIQNTIEHPIISPQKELAQLRHPEASIPGTASQYTGGQVKGLVGGAKTSLEHPLRDPFQTFMTVAPLLHMAGEAGLRGATAVKEGPGALVRKAPIAPRLIRQGEAETALHPSANPAMRVVQHAYDHVIQKALDTNPEGRIAAHGARRVGGSIAETTRFQTRMREVPANTIEAGGRKLGPGKVLRNVVTKTPRKVQEAALRLASENSTAEEARAFHLAQAEKGVGVKDNLKMAALYKSVSERGLLTKDSAGNVVIDAAKHPQLAALDAKVAAGQHAVDRVAIEHGLLTEDQAAARRNGPARIRNGAEYEAPTPGKLGKPSAGLLRQRATVDRLQTIHDRLTGKVAQETAKAARPEDAVIGSKVVGPGPLKGRTPEQAQARLDALEKEHNKALDQVAAARLGPVDRAEVARRNVENARAARQAAGVDRTGRASGASGRKSVLKQSVVEERRSQAEAIAEKAIAAHPDSPTSKAWRARTDEIDALRAGLNPMIFETADKALLGKEAKGPGRVVGTHSGPRAERIGAALSVAKDRLAQMEQAAYGYTDKKGVFHPGRQKPTGIVGGAEARPGRGFVSYKTQEPKASAATISGSSSPVVGKVRSFIGKKPFTGHGLEAGKVPDNTTRLVAQHMRQSLKFVNTDDFRARVVKTGSDTRRSSRDVLVRDPAQTAATIAKREGITLREAQAKMKLSPAVDEALGRTHTNLDTLAGHEATWAEYMQHVIPGLRDKFAADKSATIGTDAPAGFKWVDRGVLGDAARPVEGQRGRIARFSDNVNSAVTAATVYFKLGHIGTRVLTNASTAIIEGSADPLQLARSVKMWKQLGYEDRQRALAAAGQHGYAAMPHADGVGPVSKVVSGVAKTGSNWWAKHADAPFRFASIAYEARKAGFDTPAKFRDLLDKLENPAGLDAAQTARVEWVAKRANRSGIAYDRLSNAERQYITRAAWFYPWLAGASRFAVHTLVEHPYKSAVLGSAGVQGAKAQEKALGDLPDYEQGLMALGSGARPKITDLSTFSPFSTPADVLDAVARPGELSGFLNPVYGASDELINGIDQYGQHTNKPINAAAASLVSPTPESQILTAWLNRKKNQSTHMFHTTPKSALLRALGGASVPRRINVAAAHSAAARERAGR